jgi:hypothetical protein
VNARTFALVGFKLMGFWFMLQAASAAAQLPWVASSPGDAFWHLVSFWLLSVAVTGGVGAATWAGANRLSAIVCAGAHDEGGGGTPSGREPLVLALSVLGAWLTAWAIPELVNGLSLFLLSRRGSASVLGSVAYSQLEQSMVWSAAARAAVAAAVARAAVGVFLVVRARFVAGLFGSHAPDAGTPDATLEDEDAGEP